MTYKQLHTGSYTIKFFPLRKDLRSMLLTLAFLVIFSQGFASSRNVEKVYTTGSNTIVYSAGDTNSAVVTKGKITAVEGKVIHLLPGTHIKSSDQLTVNIASKECQETIAFALAKEKEQTMLTLAAKKRELLQLPNTIEEAAVFFRYHQLPQSNATLGQQNIQLTAMLVNTTVSVIAPVSLLNKKSTNIDIHSLLNLDDQSVYTPVYSWGESAENIKVMRC